MNVLGIDVSDDLLRLWAVWFAPELQPFLVEARGPLVAPRNRPLTTELRDTYELYGMPSRLRLAWLDEDAFYALRRSTRAALVRAQVTLGRALVPSVRAWSYLVGRATHEQADGHRFVWWPRLLRDHQEAVLGAFVTADRRPSRHAEVEERVWRASATVLPGARTLAGAFPAGSGPNCFGTVMAAAGVPGAHQVWMQREPFENWLVAAARRGGRDDQPGTILVWRSADNAVQHAAVTLGEGWALHKPSQGWMSPTKVLTVDDVKHSARTRGLRLGRYELIR